MAKKRSLPIRTACPEGERWKDMAPEDGGRRCRRCDRHLVDLSQLTEAQVADFVHRVRGGARVCASVSLDSEGAPIYRKRPVRRLVQTAAGLVMSVSVAACGGEPNEVGASEEQAVTAPQVEPEAAPPAPEAAVETQVEPEVAEAEPADEPAEEPTTAAEDGDGTAREPAPERPRRPRRRIRRPEPSDDPLVGLVGD